MNQIYKSFFARNSSFLSFLPFLIALNILILAVVLVAVIRIRYLKGMLRVLLKQKCDEIPIAATERTAKKKQDCDKIPREATERAAKKGEILRREATNIVKKENIVEKKRVCVLDSVSGQVRYIGKGIEYADGPVVLHGKGRFYYGNGEVMFDGFFEDNKPKEGIHYKKDGTFGCIYKNFDPDDKATAEFIQNPEKANEFRCAYSTAELFTQNPEKLNSFTCISATCFDSNTKNTSTINKDAVNKNEATIRRLYYNNSGAFALQYCGETKTDIDCDNNPCYLRHGYGRTYYPSGEKMFEGLYKDGVLYTGILYDFDGEIHNVANNGEFDRKVAEEFIEHPEKADEFLRTCSAQKSKEVMDKINNEFTQIDHNSPKASLFDLEKSKTKQI